MADAAVLGYLRVFQGRMDGALRCYEQALTHRPGYPDAVAGKAMILERHGDMNAVWALLQPVVAQGRTTPNIAITYALLAPKFGAIDLAKVLLQGLLARGSLTATQQQELHFALGKVLDKSGDYDTAFMHYAAGNRLSQFPCDVQGMHAKAERIRQVFSRPDCRWSSPR